MVSIVITYIDETGFLKEALESALQQVPAPFEIIVVCNDRFHAIDPLHLSATIPKILWIHEPIPGSAFARNTGLNHAAGDWIQFLDVDDLLLAHKVETQMSKTGGAIVSPHIYESLDGSRQISKWMPEDFWTGLLDSGLGSTSSMLWKRQALLEVGGWSSAYQSHQEYELLFRLAAAGHEIIPLDRKETIVRERKSGSITQQTKDFRAAEGIRLRETIWYYLVENSLDTPERKEAFLQYIFRQLRGLYRSDLALAKKKYHQYFSGERFTPHINGILLYPFLFKALGFTRTESIFQFYRQLRDSYIPFLPKNN